MKIDLYNCRIRLGGGEHEMHDVPKLGLSKQEVMLYADIHGNGQIIEIMPAGTRDVDEGQFHAQLSADFGPERVERVLGIKLNTIEKQMMQTEMPLQLPPQDEGRKTKQRDGVTLSP